MSFFDTATRAKSYLREHGRVSLGALRRELLSTKPHWRS